MEVAAVAFQVEAAGIVWSGGGEEWSATPDCSGPSYTRGYEGALTTPGVVTASGHLLFATEPGALMQAYTPTPTGNCIKVLNPIGQDVVFAAPAVKVDTSTWGLTPPFSVQ